MSTLTDFKKSNYVTLSFMQRVLRTSVHQVKCSQLRGLVGDIRKNDSALADAFLFHIWKISWHLLPPGLFEMVFAILKACCNMENVTYPLLCKQEADNFGSDRFVRA